MYLLNCNDTSQNYFKVKHCLNNILINVQKLFFTNNFARFATFYNENLDCKQIQYLSKNQILKFLTKLINLARKRLKSTQHLRTGHFFTVFNVFFSGQ